MAICSYPCHKILKAIRRWDGIAFSVRRGDETAIPASAIVPQPHSDPTHRTVRLRLLPGRRTVAYQLAGTAGACRWGWNHFLALQQWKYQT